MSKLHMVTNWGALAAAMTWLAVIAVAGAGGIVLIGALLHWGWRLVG